MANKSKSEPRSSVKIIEIRTPTDASKLSGSGVPVGLFCAYTRSLQESIPSIIPKKKPATVRTNTR
jgi:hypothetical protein